MYTISPLAQELEERAVQGIIALFRDEPETVNQIKEAIHDDPKLWYAPYHFGWGMAIRNYLRTDVGILDKELPSNACENDCGNWDDYYVECVEKAMAQL